MTIKAGGWEDKAVAELAEEEGLDADDLKVSRGPGRNSMMVESRGRGFSGESEWMVFKSDNDAERYAFEYVKEMLDDEPGMFKQSWLQNYLMISKTDARILVSEEADSYVENIEDDETRLMEEAGLESAWDKLEEQEWDLDEEDPEPDDYKAQMKKIEDKREDLRERAKDKVRERYESDLEDRLQNDLMDWLSEMGYEMARLPSFVQVDTDKAAKSALRDDGIAHYLDRYDGDATELRSGAIAYGTN
jgi:hypothetical protein